MARGESASEKEGAETRAATLKKTEKVQVQALFERAKWPEEAATALVEEQGSMISRRYDTLTRTRPKRSVAPSVSLAAVTMASPSPSWPKKC